MPKRPEIGVAEFCEPLETDPSRHHPFDIAMYSENAANSRPDEYPETDPKMRRPTEDFYRSSPHRDDDVAVRKGKRGGLYSACWGRKMQTQMTASDFTARCAWNLIGASVLPPYGGGTMGLVINGLELDRRNVWQTREMKVSERAKAVPRIRCRACRRSALRRFDHAGRGRRVAARARRCRSREAAP